MISPLLEIFLLSIATVQRQIPVASGWKPSYAAGSVDRRLLNRILVPSGWKDVSSSSSLAHSKDDRIHVTRSETNRPSTRTILQALSSTSSGVGGDWDENNQQQHTSNSTKLETGSSEGTKKRLLSWLFLPFWREKPSQKSKKTDKQTSLKAPPVEDDNMPVTNPTEPPAARRNNDRKRQVSRKKKRKRGMLLKRLIQFLSLAAAILIVTPHVSGELNGYQQQHMSYEKESAPWQATNHEESLSTTPVTGVEANEDSTETSVRLPDESKDSSEGRNQVKQEERTPSFFRSSEPRPSAQERKTMALSFVTEAVQKVAPSVVRIDTETHFLNQEEENGALPPRTPGFVQQGQGSGVIFSRDGLILTNAHVIEDAHRVTITMSDGRLYEAEVRGADEIVDIAVVKIIPPDGEKLNLPVAQLGDSDTLMVGRIVIAVGSAGGLDGSVTMGIVSGLERSSTVVGIPHKKVDYIQTDSAINPGNSGGPLVDVETGDVIGINAAIRAHMEGTSFSIPINRVRDIMYDLADGKEVQHGYLGVSLASCTPEWARRTNSKASSDAIKIPEVYGALVHKVFPRTPADKGGLRGGDIIIQINGLKIQTSDQARRLIDRAPVGEPLTLSVLRDKQAVDVNVFPVDLATRLKQIRRERQQQMQQERLRYQELGPFPMER